MRNRFVLSLITISIILSIGSAYVRIDDDLEKNKEEKLATILKKTAEYCERLSHSALFFVCQEKIIEEIKGLSLSGTVSAAYTSGRVKRIKVTSPKEKNEYVYDYQLVKKGTDIKESRILLEENGEKRYEKNAPLKTKRFYSLRSVFGPVGLLGKEYQEQYNYKLKKDEEVSGRKAYVIEAIPKEEIEGKPNFGKIWIDKEDFSVLKIEIAQESLAGFEELVKKMKSGGNKPKFTTIHHYGIAKKGIRFPSQTVFKEEYRPLRTVSSKTVIEYSNYRFFTVNVEVKWR